jgi:hypothetical protein
MPSVSDSGRLVRMRLLLLLGLLGGKRALRSCYQTALAQIEVCAGKKLQRTLRCLDNTTCADLVNGLDAKSHLSFLA